MASLEVDLDSHVLSKEVLEKLKSEFKVKVSPLVLKRRGLKVRVTNFTKKLNDDRDLESISSISRGINDCFEKIKALDREIEDIFLNSELLDHDFSNFEKEMESQADYSFEIQKTIFKCEEFLSEISKPNKDLNFTISKSEPKPPQLKCMTFGGNDDENFRLFLAQFENVIGYRKDFTDASKLQYLKSFLRSFALCEVEHFPITDDNYTRALGALKDRFLNIPLIIDTIFHKIDSRSRICEGNWNAVRNFLSEVRGYLFELKEFKFDFFEELTSGCVLMSHLIVDKLPSDFLRELEILTKAPFPSINLILDNYLDILRSMERRVKTGSGSKLCTDSKPKADDATSINVSSVNHFEPNQETTRDANRAKKCKLCGLNHTITFCDRFKDFNSRVGRCEALSLCSLCSSAKHNKSNCNVGLSYPCAICNKSRHISALCPNFNFDNFKNRKDFKVKPSAIRNNLCINTSKISRNYLLPTISLELGFGAKRRVTRCLLDLGSQRSYIHKNVILRLGGKPEFMREYTCDLKTFVGSQRRSVKETEMQVYLNQGEGQEIEMLVTDLDLDFKVHGLRDAIKNLAQEESRFADSNFNTALHSDNVSGVECLLGTDALQFFKQFSFSKRLRGTVINTSFGIIPFGDIGNFLTHDQRRNLEFSSAEVTENLARHQRKGKPKSA